VFELLAVPQRGVPYVQMGPEDLNPKIFRITRSVDKVVAETGTELVPTLSPEDGEQSSFSRCMQLACPGLQWAC